MCEIEQKPLPLRNGGIFLGPGVKEIPKVCQRNPHDPKLAPAYARACVPASMSLGKRMHQHMHEHMSMHASTRANMHEHMSLHASSWPTVRGPANREPSAPQLEPRGARPADLDLGQRTSTSASGPRPRPAELDLDQRSSASTSGPRPADLDQRTSTSGPRPADLDLDQRSSASAPRTTARAARPAGQKHGRRSSTRRSETRPAAAYRAHRSTRHEPWAMSPAGPRRPPEPAC
jgi:hypothetical protein